jgi:hypothetical protein
MKKYENNQGILLKIDIEGSEYDFIDLIEQYEKNIIGFVIEFHDLDKNISIPLILASAYVYMYLY